MFWEEGTINSGEALGQEVLGGVSLAEPLKSTAFMAIRKALGQLLWPGRSP